MSSVCIVEQLVIVNNIKYWVLHKNSSMANLCRRQQRNLLRSWSKVAVFVSIFNQSWIFLTDAPRRELRDEDIESEVICDTDSDEYVEDT
jgi:hypothetical protein